MQAGAQLANPGDILLGKYRVEEVIGIGGMGRVVKAMHLYLNQPVAIKILLPNMAESEGTVARFLREAQSTVKLRSEHLRAWTARETLVRVLANLQNIYQQSGDAKRAQSAAERIGMLMRK